MAWLPEGGDHALRSWVRMAVTQAVRDMRKTKKDLVEELSTLRSRLTNRETDDIRFQGWQACTNTLIDAFLVTSANGQSLIFTNAAGFALLEVKDLTQTQPLSTYVHESERLAMRERILRVQRTNKGEAFEATRFIDGKGNTFYAEGSVSPDGDGDQFVLKWVVRDVTERVVAQQELAARESMEREKAKFFDAIVNEIPAVITVKDKEGRYIFLNRQMEAIKSPAQLTGTSLSDADIDIENERNRSDIDQLTRRVIETGEPVSNLERKGYYQADRTWLTSIVPIMNERGGVEQVVTISNDISARKEAEAELLEKNRLLQTMIDYIPASIALRDLDGRYVMANREAIERLGAKGRPVVGMKAVDLMPAAVAAAYDELAAKVIANGETFTGVERAGFQDPSLTYALTTVPVRSENGEISGVLSITVDISERKRAEADLAEKSAILNVLFENLPAQISLKDSEGRYLLFNDYLKGKGRLSQDYRGKTVFELHGTESARKIDDLTRHVIATGEPLIGYEREPSYMSTVSYSSDIVPVKGADGRVQYVVMLSKDVTDVKKAQTELARHRDQLQELVHERTKELEAAQAELLLGERAAAIGHLTASVSHELRNPLGTIRTSFQVVRLGLGDGVAPVSRAIDRIERNIDRCVNIIEELLNYTECSGLEALPVDIDAWCANLAVNAGVPATIKVRTDMQSNARPAMDWDRMGRALQHLIRNAVQSLNETEAGQNGDGEITVATRSCENVVKITVSDNGPGVPAEIRHKIFEPLVSSKVYGVGLGLPIVRQTIEMHGGTVYLREPHAGAAGTTFVLELPLASA